MAAKTPAERKIKERQRKTVEGLHEVRGIWAKKPDHARIKEMARHLPPQDA
jgi:hypothetical protein